MTKTGFISGATSGIGLVTANQLQKLGWRVYGAALPDDDFSLLDEAIIRMSLDISNQDAVLATAQQIEDEVGHLDGLVNNAGIQVASPLEVIDLDDLRAQFEVNVFGHLQVIQAMMPLLRVSQSARIVNVSSLMGLVAMPMLGAYSMSKHALEAMSDVLRLELKPFGINVAVIEMGAIDTPMTHSMAETLEKVRQGLNAEAQNHYAKLFDGMTAALQSQGKNATAPEKIADAIIHALTNPKPKSRYSIGIEVVGLSTIRKIFPDAVGDFVLLRALGLD